MVLIERANETNDNTMPDKNILAILYEEISKDPREASRITASSDLFCLPANQDGKKWRATTGLRRRKMICVDMKTLSATSLRRCVTQIKK